jgi:hypothetical protein
MIYFLALIPATALTVAGYCVLYVSRRSEGSFRAFGKYLGFWAFSLAGLVILAAIFAAAHGEHHGHGMMHRPWADDPRSFRHDFGAPPDAERPPAAPNPEPAPAR